MDFLRRLLFHNFLLKLISVVSALLLWSAIAREPSVEVVHTVPIEFLHVPEDVAINSPEVPQVQLWIHGPLREVRDLDPRDLHPAIDLAGVRVPSERTYEILPTHIKTPHGVDVVQIVPAQFHLSFDRRVFREVEVKPRVSGDLPAGFRLADVRSDPPRVVIAGPERRVRAVEAALTDPVDITGVAGRATFTTNAYATDPLVRIMRSNQVRVTVITQKDEAGR